MGDKKITLKNIPGVQILETGEYACSSGVHQFSESDLQSAVSAIHNDPAIHEPRLKFGHVGEQGSIAGMPVFGKVSNMHLTAEGNRIDGDLVGLPDWLAEILPTAYPSRSIEGRWNYTSASGQTHQFVILAVSLLGVELPGCETLDDLEHLYANGPDDVLVEAAADVVATYNFDRKDDVGKKKVSASADPYDVRRAFHESFAVGDRYSWWVHELYVSPSEIIAEDESANTFHRVTYTIDGDDNVTFGDPVQVKKQYVPIGTAAAGSAEAPALVFATRAESRENKETEMKLTDDQQIKLRKRLGLADDADEATILETLSADVEDTPPDPTPKPDEDNTPDPVEDPTPVPDDPAQAPAAAAGTVSFDEATAKQLREDAAAGRAARDEQVKTRRIGVVKAAILDGKIPPAREDHYMKLMELDEQGTTATLSGLEKGLIPTTERGTSADASGSDAEDTAYPASWKPRRPTRDAG